MSNDSFNDLFAGLHSVNRENHDNKKEEKTNDTPKQTTNNKDSDSFNKMLNSLQTHKADSKKAKDEQSSSKFKQALGNHEQSSKTDLYKSGMDKIKVTRDGKTLEEMLPTLRGGTLPIDDQIKKLKSNENEVEVNGHIKHDERYLEHHKLIDNQKSDAIAREKLSNKYVQRNSRYTENEKIIMTNLGLDMKGLVNVMKKPNDQLTRYDKMKILSVGRKGLERYYKGKRFRVTRGDTDMLEFLAKFKLASVRILSMIRDETQSITNRRLQRMKKNGLTADYEVPGLATVWTITEIGMAIIGYDLTTYRQRRPKMSVLPPIIGINYVAACLWHNKFNVLFLDDFPGKHKTINGADGKSWKTDGENLVSELEIRSSFGKEMKPQGDSSFSGVSASSQEIVIKNAQLTWHKWVKDGHNQVSPELYPGNEYLWILFPEGGLTVSFHVPDLVIQRDRDSDGRPKSIAVECELTKKSHKNYVNTMRAYKEDKYLYEKVIWITNNAAIERRLREAAEEVGYTDYDIVPFTNKSGIFKDRDILHI